MIHILLSVFFLLAQFYVLIAVDLILHSFHCIQEPLLLRLSVLAEVDHSLVIQGSSLETFLEVFMSAKEFHNSMAGYSVQVFHSGKV